MKHSPKISRFDVSARASTSRTVAAAPSPKKPKHWRAEPGVQHASNETRRLYHELQVHQVELETQNSELRNTRDDLELALENYTNLYDFAPVGYFTISAAGLILRVNLAGAILAGAVRSRLIGRAFDLLVGAPQRRDFQSFLKQVFSGGAKRVGDFEFALAGQPTRTVNLEAQRLPSGHECLAAVIDVTERKRQEERVRMSEIRYRRLFEAAHDGVLLVNPETRKITDANPFMTKLLGYTSSQLVGKELFEIGLLKDETASQDMFLRLKRNHEVRYQDLPLQNKSGHHQDVEVVANVYEENGRSVIQCNIRDITERKGTEDTLRRNEALFSALLMQAPVGVYVVDARLRLQQVNPKAEPVFANICPLMGRDFSEIIHLLWPRRVADEVLARFRQTLETGVPFETADFVERRKDLGTREYYEWQIQRVTLPAGEYGVVCFFNNVTERKQTEEVQRRLDVLTSSNRKLEAEIVRRRTTEAALAKSERHQSQLLKKSDRMQEQLRNLSHKILRAQEEERKRISRELHDIVAQTLVGIHLHLTALTEKGLRDPQNLQQRVARTQLLLEESVETMHRFARELRPKMLDDLGLIPALHAYLDEFTKRTGVLSKLTAFAAAEQASLATRTVFYRVAQEALANVANHSHATRVHVHLEKQGDSIQMRIADDGRSFDVKQALRPHGVGRLGLLGMRERLEMVGGSFDIQSTAGVGTEVTAQIPLSKAVRLRIDETHWRLPDSETPPASRKITNKMGAIPRRRKAGAPRK